ncbi:hypothetical protein M8494_10345 [Serratia ureilytica]
MSNQSHRDRFCVWRGWAASFSRFTQSTRLITQRGTARGRKILPLFTQQGSGFVYSGDGAADIMVRRQRALTKSREQDRQRGATRRVRHFSTQPRRWLAESRQGDGRRAAVIGAHRRTSG